MQGKGIIQTFMFLLLAGCAWFIVLNFPTQQAEKKAKEYGISSAKGLKEGSLEYSEAISDGEIRYLDSISDEEIFLGQTYNDIKKSQVGLGLDLKGGMSAVLQVDIKNLLLQLANNTNDPVFNQALDKAEKDLQNTQGKFVQVFGKTFNEIGGGKALAPFFVESVSLEDKITLNSSNTAVIDELQKIADANVNTTFELLKKRIDKLGVTQPNISLDDQRDLIFIELPGVKNPKRARGFLQNTANLEFYETYRLEDPAIQNGLIQADAFLKSLEKTTTTEGKTSYQYVRDTITGNIIDSVKVSSDSTLAKGPGPLFRIMQPYGYTKLGIVSKKNVEEVKTILSKPEVLKYFPSDLKFSVGFKPEKDENGVLTSNYAVYGIKLPKSGKAELDGDLVANASNDIDPMSGQHLVSLEFKDKGASIWSQMTDRAFVAPKSEQNREIAITLDNEVVSAPTVQGILSTNSQITGDFTADEAKDLATFLQVGKLPAKLKIVQESVVGPTLGKDNINRSITSLVAGFLLVLLFMYMYYGGAGIVAIITSIINLIFIYGALASFNVVMTLPGIAGIVLTIGMAVDANVIIFERIKEEIASGKSLLQSVIGGFNASYSAIIDANVTTFITAIVLFVFGLGPIKGFAVILMIGIITSFVTAVIIGRMFIQSKVSSGKNLSFSTPIAEKIFKSSNYKFLSKRKIAYTFSALMIAASLVSIFTRRFDLGVDFKGGYKTMVHFNKEVNISEVRKVFAAEFGSEPIVKEVKGTNAYDITTDYAIEDADVEEKVLAKIHKGAMKLSGENISFQDFNNPNNLQSTRKLSSSLTKPVIADDILKSSYKSLVIAILCIFGYIFIRFRKWAFSVGAIIALIHDSVIVLGVFSLFWGILPLNLEIDQAFIAAILTVIGYSINDTVIVFDRVREYLNIHSKKSQEEIIDSAMSSTLSRTVITSLTTLFVILILLIFSSGSITGFAFALFIGILVGTYSSIFIATPLFYDFSKKSIKNEN